MSIDAQVLQAAAAAAEANSTATVNAAATLWQSFRQCAQAHPVATGVAVVVGGGLATYGLYTVVKKAFSDK